MSAVPFDAPIPLPSLVSFAATGPSCATAVPTGPAAAIPATPTSTTATAMSAILRFIT